MNHVSFKYSQAAERIALCRISIFIFRSGETIGIIGGTGSSKTTLIQLISRLYDATEGAVKVGGVDVREYDLEDPAQCRWPLCCRKTCCFPAPLRKTCAGAIRTPTDEELAHACKLAQADEFILQFPDGYDTYIEQGRHQRIRRAESSGCALPARCSKKPKVLILDDSTSAVDTRTDALIRQAFRQEIPGTTKLIIAQRVASVAGRGPASSSLDGGPDRRRGHPSAAAANATRFTARCSSLAE